MLRLSQYVLIIVEYHTAKVEQRVRRRSPLFSVALRSAPFCRSSGEEMAASDELYYFSDILERSANSLRWKIPPRSRC